MTDDTQLQTARINQTQKYDPSNLKELFMWAKAIINSSLVPSHIRKPEDAVLVVQQGRELGISALASLNNIYVVKGKPTISAKLCVALVQQSPDCEYFMCSHTDAERAVYKTKRRNNPDEQTYEFTREMAQQAGLFSNNVWKQYTDVMLRHRCAKYLADMVYPEVTSGLYLAEEMGAEVDPEGVPVKVDVVDADFDDAQDAEVVEPEPSMEEALDKQRKRFYALVCEAYAGTDDKGEKIDAFRKFIKGAYEVDSFNDISLGKLRTLNSTIDDLPCKDDSGSNPRREWINSKMEGE